MANEAVVPLEEWYGRRRARPIAGNPGAWRNRPERCRHMVDRSVTRCWICDPLCVGEDARCLRSQQKRPRVIDAERRRALLVGLLDGPLTMEAAAAVFGSGIEALDVAVRSLRVQNMIRSRAGTLTLTLRGRRVAERGAP